MAYEKRVCVLKQVRKGFSADGGELTGAVYCERLGETLTITPRLLGLAPVREGRYALSLSVGGKTYCLELAGNARLTVEKSPSLRGGFSALVVFVRGEAEPVAFGACGDAPKNYLRLLEAVGGEKRPAVPLPPNEVPFPNQPNSPHAPTVPLPGPEPEKEETRPFRRKYDDEAIAASDYFGAQAHEDEDPARLGEEEAGEVAGGGDPLAHEAPLDPRGSLTYYNSMRERLEAALKKFPPDERLKETFPLSEWVRAESGALLGVIYERGAPRYLCVAVEKAGDPPAEMKKHCAFVPASPYTEEEGFWVVFQDADTGEYIKVYDA